VTMGFPEIAISVMAIVSLYTDLSTQRVPNLLTFGGMALGVAWGLSQGSWLASLGGIGVAFACMFPGWMFARAVRAGDAKLLMAFGALLGPEDIFRACALTYVLNLPFGLVVLAAKGRLGNIPRVIRASYGKVTGQAVVAEPMEVTVVPFVPVVVAATLLAMHTEVLRW